MTHPQWLHSFLTVVQTGNFTQAAERLNLTQAAVSQHMQKLEAQFGQLLIRQGRRQQLTPRGEKVLAYAKEVAAADARLQLSLADDPDSGPVAIATPGSIGLALYPLLLDIQSARPELRIHHRFAPSQEIVELVLQNRVELGLLTIKPDDPRLKVTPFAREPLRLVLPAGVAYRGWDDLCALGFIDHPDGREMAIRFFSRHHPGARVDELPITGFINQIGLILEPVARGLGFTVLPGFAVQAFRDQTLIRAVPGVPEVVDTLWLIHRAEWSLSARAEGVLSQLAARLTPAAS